MICFYPPQFFESFLIVIPFVVFVFNFLFLFFPCIESISFIIYIICIYIFNLDPMFRGHPRGLEPPPRRQKTSATSSATSTNNSKIYTLNGDHPYSSLPQTYWRDHTGLYLQLRLAHRRCFALRRLLSRTLHVCSSSSCYSGSRCWGVLFLVEAH